MGVHLLMECHMATTASSDSRQNLLMLDSAKLFDVTSNLQTTETEEQAKSDHMRKAIRNTEEN